MLQPGGAALLQLFAYKNQTLLGGQGALLVWGFRLDILRGVAELAQRAPVLPVRASQTPASPHLLGRLARRLLEELASSILTEATFSWESGSQGFNL